MGRRPARRPRAPADDTSGEERRFDGGGGDSTLSFEARIFAARRRRRADSPAGGSRMSSKPAEPPADKGDAPKDKAPARDDTFYRTWDRFLGKPRARDAAAAAAAAEPDGARDNAVRSYDDAAAHCRARVDAIAKECRRLNRKYHDPIFELPYDDALVSLAGYRDGNKPLSTDDRIGAVRARRVTEIFKAPRFTIDGATAQDVRQGRVGDCWFLAAVMALAGKDGLIERVCVARDEACGVYGFVFFRDGEWASEVIDDRLCVRHHEDSNLTLVYGAGPAGKRRDDEFRAKLPKKIAEELTRGPDNLFFAQCMDTDETWLPLLEKAYAKAHGSYQSIEGGWAGEAIEDLTGGVNTWLQSDEILNKDQLWSELKRVNVDFLFGCGSRMGSDQVGPDDEGLVRAHAYTVLEAKEYKDVRLLKIRNPWGKQEWNGAWSDGSKEWDMAALEYLRHTFGDDGIFWIKFDDFLQYYPDIDRTRLFGPEWTIVQQWMSTKVPRSISYLDTAYLAHKAHLKLTKPGPVVIMLCQPDTRYFQGLEGRFSFDLHFRLARHGSEDYLLRSMADTESRRSCNAEIDLEAGEYDIYIKVTPWRDDKSATAAEVIKKLCNEFREKVLATGKSYDSAHAKGMLRKRELELEQEAREKKRSEKLVRLKAQKRFNVETRRRDKLRSHRNRDAEERKRQAKRDERERAGPSVKHKHKRDEVEKEPRGKHDDDGGDKGSVVTALSEDEGDEDRSDGTSVSSVADDDFAWESEIDDPVEGGESSNESDEEEVEGMPDVDGWNAICVVGLRVYSQDAEAQVEIHEG